MKQFRCVLILMLVFCGGMTLTGTGLASAAEDPTTAVSNRAKLLSSKPDSSVVDYLRHIVAGDQLLKAALENNIEKAGEKGVEHQFWRGKTLEDLYGFFDDWLINPLEPTENRFGIVDGRIVRHDYLFWDLLNADENLRIHNVFMGWMALFMNARQHFLLSGESARYLPEWLSDKRVVIKDYKIPAGGFQSFNEFFLRDLTPGARPIAQPQNGAVPVSPVDCTVTHLYDVDPDKSIKVKGERLDFSDLLNSDPIASKFTNGPAYTCNLMLYNYHHFHSPVTGRIVKIGQVGGIYYFDTGFRHLYEHRRAYVIFETEKLGLVALVAVGQVMVNSIRLIVGEGDTVRKGQELGHFDFGGSEVVMMFQPGKVLLSDAVTPGHVFKLGQSLGTAQ